MTSPNDVLAAVLHHHAGRFVGDGVHATDLEQILSRIRTWDDWFDAWAHRANAYVAHAERALGEGNSVTEGEWLWQGSLYYHYAQFLWFHDLERREDGQRRKVDLYRRAAALLMPAAERVDIPFEGYRIPAYIRLPAIGRPPYACVVLLGGLESTKEESYHFENLCLRRGLATCAFDGPGQGEMVFQVRLRPDFERFTGAVVDYLRTREDIDAENLGVLGRSLGGYYAVRAASLVPGFRACVVWGALYDLEHWERIPPLTRRGFAYVSGYDDLNEAGDYLRKVINLAGVAEQLRCPLYILHGAQDDILPGTHVQRLQADTRHVEQAIIVEPSGNHCCHNIYPIVRPRMADWLAQQLLVEGGNR